METKNLRIYFVLNLVCCITNINSQCIEENYNDNEFDTTVLNLEISNPESFHPQNGLRGVYEGKEYYVEAKARLAETRAAKYQLQLIVPSDFAKQRVDCDKFETGLSNTICGSEYPLVNDTFMISISNKTGPNILRYSNSPIELLREAIDVLTIDYGCVNTTIDGVQNQDDEISFQLKFMVNSGLQSKNLTFFLRLLAGGKLIKTVRTSLSISPLGPNLRAILSLTNYNTVQSGYILKYKGTIFHLEGTTEDALNLHISASSENIGGVVLTNKIRFKLPNAEYVNVTNMNPIVSGISLTKKFLHSNPITIKFEVEVTDDLVLGDKRYFQSSLTVKYLGLQSGKYFI